MQYRKPPVVNGKDDWISIRSHDDRNVLLIRKSSIESVNRFTSGEKVHFTVTVRNKENCIEIPSAIFEIRHIDDFFRSLCE